MTKAERDRYAQLVELGCIVCHMQGHGYSAPEVHHTRHTAGMGQRSHWSMAIALCHAHHRTGGYGTAFHAGKGAFEANCGTELDLLAETRKLLGEMK